MKEIEYKIHYDNLDKLKIEGVYLIRNLENNKLKIGKTNDLTRRLSDIKSSFKFCGTPPNLKVECFIEYTHSIELEQFLHKELKEYNHQNEWFSIDDINLILNKIVKFQHKEPIKYSPVPHINKVKNEVKVSKYALDYNKYYKYEFKNYKIDCIVYLKRNRTTYGILEDIGKIASSVGYLWGSYYINEYYLEEVYINLDKLDCMFKKFNTDSLALVDGKLMRLDVYLGNIIRNKKIESLIKNKDSIEKIINDMTTSEYDCNNIDIIKSDIEDIENKCIQIQEYLNEGIEQHHRNNYKMYGMA